MYCLVLMLIVQCLTTSLSFLDLHLPRALTQFGKVSYPSYFELLAAKTELFDFNSKCYIQW